MAIHDKEGKMRDDLYDDVVMGRKYIGIWGVGYIGYSTAAFFAKKGVRSFAFDKDSKKISGLNQAKINLPNIEYWLGFDVKPLISSGMIKGLKNWKRMISKDIVVHFICVPTEKGAEPYDEALKDVMEKLVLYKGMKMNYPPLIIIESTISADRIEKIILPIFKRNYIILGQDMFLAVAPRRDWFISAEKSVKTLPRVVGGTTPQVTEIASKILGIVCDTVLKASDHIHAALIKSVENTYRQVGISLANQLMLAYPHVNMREVLRLVGTKWNIDTYHPSFGIGGYCIPLAPHYVLNGATDPHDLTIITESIHFAEQIPYKMVDIIAKKGFKKVGILGLAYKGDLKVDILSPTLELAKGFRNKGIDVKVNDPYYIKKVIEKKTQVKSFRFPEGLNEFDCVLLVSDHSLYKYTVEEKILKNLSKCRMVIDNIGIWKHFKWENIEYHEVGDGGWF